MRHGINEAEVRGYLAALEQGSIEKGGKRTLLVATGNKALEHGLAQGKPGQWASDHRAEAQHATGWHFVAVKALAQAAQQCKVTVYDDDPKLKKDDGIKKSYNPDSEESQPVDSNHEVMQFLERPNPFQSGASFRFEEIMQLALTGTALIWNIKNAFGKVVRRYVIPTACAQPYGPSPEFPDGFWRVELETTLWAQLAVYHGNAFSSLADSRIDAREVQVVRLPHPMNKDDGWSTVSAVAAWTDSADQIDRSRMNQFRNGHKPDLIVNLKEFTGDQAELDAYQARLDAKYAGTSNRGKAVVVAGHDAEVTPVAHRVDEMSYMASADQMRDSILAAYGVSPVAVGISAPSGRDGLYAPILQFARNVQPLLTLMAEEDNEWVIWQYGTFLRVEYEADRLDDPDQDREDMNLLITAKAITKGEIRVRLGMEKFGDERDDEIAGESAMPQMGMPGMPGMPGVPGAPGMPPGAKPNPFGAPGVPGAGKPGPAVASGNGQAQNNGAASSPPAGNRLMVRKSRLYHMNGHESNGFSTNGAH